jgi:hypothetical protein
METWNNGRLLQHIFTIVCNIPQQPNDVYLKANFRERLGKKLKLTIIWMPRAIIVEVNNLAREIEE